MSVAPQVENISVSVLHKFCDGEYCRRLVIHVDDSYIPAEGIAFLVYKNKRVVLFGKSSYFPIPGIITEKDCAADHLTLKHVLDFSYFICPFRKLDKCLVVLLLSLADDQVDHFRGEVARDVFACSRVGFGVGREEADDSFFFSNETASTAVGYEVQLIDVFPDLVGCLFRHSISTVYHFRYGNSRYAYELCKFFSCHQNIPLTCRSLCGCDSDCILFP